MADFLFGEWPHGLGPALVQVALIVGGSALGIRVIDDVARIRKSIRIRRPRG